MVHACLSSVIPTLIWKLLVPTESIIRAYNNGMAYSTLDFKENLKVTKHIEAIVTLES